MTKHGPKRADPERSRDAILDAAHAEFAVHGFARTKLETIADRAGVAKGLVGYHFSTKEDLLQQVIAKVIPRLHEGVEPVVLAKRETVTSLLRRTIRQIYTNILERPEAGTMLRLLVAEGQRHPKLTRFYRDEVAARGGRILTEIVNLGYASGEFTTAGSETLSAIITGPIISLVFRQILFDTLHPIDLADHIERHITLVVQGLSSRPGDGVVRPPPTDTRPVRRMRSRRRLHRP